MTHDAEVIYMDMEATDPVRFTTNEHTWISIGLNEVDVLGEVPELRVPALRVSVLDCRLYPEVRMRGPEHGAQP